MEACDDVDRLNHPDNQPGTRIEGVEAPTFEELIFLVNARLALGWRTFLRAEFKPSDHRGGRDWCAIVQFNRADDPRAPNRLPLLLSCRRCGDTTGATKVRFLDRACARCSAPFDVFDDE